MTILQKIAEIYKLNGSEERTEILLTVPEPPPCLGNEKISSLYSIKCTNKIPSINTASSPMAAAILYSIQYP